MKGGDYQLKLTEKQKRFADLYIESGNATEAYIKAGYTVKNGSARANASRLLTNANVKKHITKRLKQIEDSKIANLTEALQGITAIARGTELEESEIINPVTGQKETTASPPKMPTRLAAWKEIVKRFPQSDELMALQIRKMKADAEISELKARMLKDNGADVEQVLDAVIDKISGVDSNGSE